MARGEPTPRQHEAGMALGDVERDPGWDNCTTAGRCQYRVSSGDQVTARVAEAGVARHRKIHVEANELNLDHVRAP
jgi:hypothetical protein